MKRFSLLFMGFLAALLFCLAPAFALASTEHSEVFLSASEDGEVRLLRASAYFSGYSVSFIKSDGGGITIKFTVTGVTNSTKIGVSTWQLQQKSGSSYINVGSAQSGSTASNTATHSFSRSINGTPGVTYRVKCTFTCTNSSGTATTDVTSSDCTARQ